jgi:predicted dehydrogenase
MASRRGLRACLEEAQSAIDTPGGMQMADDSFGVGVIGVRSGHGWGPTHLLAIAAQPENFRLVGIANSTADSGRLAAEEYGVARAFDSADALIASDEVDVVAVTVRLPQHFKLVEAALNAGKTVFCEWPLALGLAQSRALATLAREKALRTVIGTQARVAPTIHQLRDLVAQGYVGEVLSTTLIGSGVGWGAMVDEAGSYILDAANGATLLSIPFGHMMAAVEDVLGPVAAVSAQLSSSRKTCHIYDKGEDRAMTAPDQLLVAGMLERGAPISVHYRGGEQRSTGLRWEINGTEGDLLVTGPNGHGQMIALELFGGRGDRKAVERLAVPASRFDDLDDHVVNVALLYDALAADLRSGGHSAPDFDDALRTHRLIEAIEQSARSGSRVSLGSGG